MYHQQTRGCLSTNKPALLVHVCWAIPTDHEWQEAQDGLCLLLCRVVVLWGDQLLAGILAGHQQQGQHQVGTSIMPADRRVTVHEWEQP